MAFTIPNGAHIQIQVCGRLHGQRTRTTFNYVYNGGASAPDGAESLNALLNDFETAIGAQIRTLSSEEWEHEFTQGQVITPVRYRVQVVDVGVAGLVEGACCPSGVCVLLRRYTQLSGSRFQGRIYLPGVPVANEEDSMIPIAKRDDYDTLRANMIATLEGVDASEDFVPVVTPSAPSLPQDQVYGVALDPVLRYQRRREIGVGE